MFDVSISIKNDKILGEFVVDSYFFEPSKYTYAFYLYKNDERVDIAWYSSNMNVAFDLKGMTGIFYIKVFVKSIEQGNAKTYSSQKLIVDD